MPEFTTSRRIAAPAQQVFELFTDLRRAADLIGSIERLEVLTDGPVRGGTRFRETRSILGKRSTEELEVASFDPPRGYSVACETCGSRFLTEFSFTPEGPEATRVDVRFQAVPISFGARLFAPLGKLMLASCEKAFARDLDDLQSTLESPRPAAAL